MSTVDGTLASGIYRDRHGRYWEACKVTSCSEPGEWWNYHDMARNGGRHLTVTQMRLLIERDQHRDVCPGLRRCFRHPVPHVLIAEWDHDRFEGFMVYPVGYMALPAHEDIDTLPRAMDAARALSVDP